MADISQIQTLGKAGWSRCKIARHLGCDRDTVAKYLRQTLQAHGPPPGTADPPDPKPAIPTAGKIGRQSTCDPFRARIESLLERGFTAEGIWRELRGEKGEPAFTCSYEAVKRVPVRANSGDFFALFTKDDFGARVRPDFFHALPGTAPLLRPRPGTGRVAEP